MYYQNQAPILGKTILLFMHRNINLLLDDGDQNIICRPQFAPIGKELMIKTGGENYYDVGNQKPRNPKKAFFIQLTSAYLHGRTLTRIFEWLSIATDYKWLLVPCSTDEKDFVVYDVLNQRELSKKSIEVLCDAENETYIKIKDDENDIIFKTSKISNRHGATTELISER